MKDVNNNNIDNIKLNTAIMEIRKNNMQRVSNIVTKIVCVCTVLLSILAFIRYGFTPTPFWATGCMTFSIVIILVVKKQFKKEVIKATIILSVCALLANVYSVIIGGSAGAFMLNYVIIAMSAMYFHNGITMYCAIPIIIQVAILAIVYPAAINGAGATSAQAFDAIFFLAGCTFLTRQINNMGAEINKQTYEGLVTIEENNTKFSEISSELNDIVIESNELVMDLVGQSNNIDGAASSIHNDSKNIVVSVDTVNESVDSVREYIDLDENIATELKEKYEIVVNSVKDGMDRIISTKKVMGEMEEIVIDAYKSTKDLVIRMGEIDAILEEIDSIFSQTRLLALNASIEAARTGELGKGFEVVASEIRNLSDESAKASNNIKSIIEVLNATVIEAQDMIKEGVIVSRKGYKQMDSLTDTLDTINYTSEIVEDVIDKEKELVGSIGEEFNSIASQVHDLSNLSKDNIDTLKDIKGNIDEQTQSIHSLDDKMKNVGSLAKEMVTA